jgi:hypothetical protein
MTNELRPGKRTFIRKGTLEFELPDQHEVELFEGEPPWVMLSTPQMGGRYALDGIEEIDDRVIVRVGDFLDGHGPGTSGEYEVPEVTGYPFPS